MMLPSSFSMRCTAVSDGRLVLRLRYASDMVKTAHRQCFGQIGALAAIAAELFRYQAASGDITGNLVCLRIEHVQVFAARQ